MLCTRTFLLISTGLLVAAVAAPAKTMDRKVDFTNQIKPIFKNECYGCHSTGHAKGGLDLSTKSGILKGGDSGKLFTVGKASQSLLVKRLKGQGGTRMPKGDDPLKEAQIKAVSKWIDQGARM